MSAAHPFATVIDAPPSVMLVRHRVWQARNIERQIVTTILWAFLAIGWAFAFADALAHLGFRLRGTG